MYVPVSNLKIWVKYLLFPATLNRSISFGEKNKLTLCTTPWKWHHDCSAILNWPWKLEAIVVGLLVSVPRRFLWIENHSLCFLAINISIFYFEGCLDWFTAIQVRVSDIAIIPEWTRILHKQWAVHKSLNGCEPLFERSKFSDLLF